MQNGGDTADGATYVFYVPSYISAHQFKTMYPFLGRSKNG
jgi:hypothetical protein